MSSILTDSVQPGWAPELSSTRPTDYAFWHHTAVIIEANEIEQLLLPPKGRGVPSPLAESMLLSLFLKDPPLLASNTVPWVSSALNALTVPSGRLWLCLTPLLPVAFFFLLLSFLSSIARLILLFWRATGHTVNVRLWIPNNSLQAITLYPGNASMLPSGAHVPSLWILYFAYCSCWLKTRNLVCE